MQAIAFEADIVDEFLRIPNFELFKNQHVRVVIEATQESNDATITKLPQAFLNPVSVQDYSKLGTRESLYSSPQSTPSLMQRLQEWRSELDGEDLSEVFDDVRQYDQGRAFSW
jgi:hypothetical protein